MSNSAGAALNLSSLRTSVGETCLVITIRTALPEDLDAVVDLWGRAAGPTRHAGQRHEAEVLLRRDPDALVVADVDGQLVGSLIVGWDGWRCHLYRLAVDASFRRQRIGQQLLERALSRAVAVGAVRADAMVNRENANAVAFWENEGFEYDTSDGRWSFLVGEVSVR
jgi:ribosomal protein S18 acetylase RimI-like enzyme